MQPKQAGDGAGSRFLDLLTTALNACDVRWQLRAVPPAELMSP